MELIFKFFEVFYYSVYFLGPILVLIFCIVVTLGQLVGRWEKWMRFGALYWSLITASTVGYGDIRPTHRRSKLISIGIAIMGIIFTGFIVAISVNAATAALNQNEEIRALQKQHPSLSNQSSLR